MLLAAPRENYRLDQAIATLAAGPHPNPPPLKRGAGIEESPASAFLSPTFSLAATPSPAPLMGAGRGGGDAFRTNGTSPSRRHSAVEPVTRHCCRTAPHPCMLLGPTHCRDAS